MEVEVKRLFYLLPADQVLGLIDPVDPDSLQSTKPGVWTAKWCPPVPGGDIEALRRTPGVEVVREEYEPEGLPGWLAVDFGIISLNEEVV